MKKYLSLAALLGVCTWAIEMQWRRGQSLTALLLIWGLALAAIVWLTRLPATAPAAVTEKPPLASPTSLRLGWLGGLLGLAAAWAAFRSFFKADLDWTLCWVLISAVLLRGQWRDDDDAFPYLDERLLLLAVIGGATWFRFRHLGEIPVAISVPDEAMLKLKAHMYLGGLRETFAMGPGSIQDGALPFYLEALSMKLFGHGLQGFRTLIALIGVVLSFLVYGIGKELLGRRVGLLAGAFMAFSLWSLGISQVNYLMNESLLVLLLVFYATLVGLRRNSALWFTLAGFSFGLCFNAYKSMQLVLALLPYLLLLLAVYEPERRPGILRSITPMLAGAILALIPLLLWAYWGGEIAYKAFFSSLNASHIVGTGAVQPTLVGKMNFLFGRAFPWFPQMLTLFSSRGPTTAATFSSTLPLASPALVLLTLLGLAACLVRGRRVGALFLLLWFFYGFLPALVAEPSSIPNDRRAIMVLPAMMLLAGQGLAAALSILSRVGGRAKGALLALGLLGFFGYYAHDNWDLWFVKTNQDMGYLNYNRANIGVIHRVTFQTDQKTPLRVLQTHVQHQPGFFTPMFDPTQSEYAAITGSDIPTLPMWSNPEHFSQGGMLHWLTQLDNRPPFDGIERTWAVSLDPFYYYMEPLLLELGGRRVAEVPVVQSSTGPVQWWRGMAFDDKSLSRLVLLPRPAPGVIDAMIKEHSLPYTVQELTPPRRIGTREQALQFSLWSPQNLAAQEDYHAHPQAWRPIKTVRFSLPDVWFWTLSRNFPEAPVPPLRLNAHWMLRAPEPGTYRLGASSNLPIRVDVDGTPAFDWRPDPTMQDNDLRKGYLGSELRLTGRPQRLDIEQLSVSMNGSYAHILRLIWQKPDGTIETIPLSSLAR